MPSACRAIPPIIQNPPQKWPDSLNHTPIHDVNQEDRETDGCSGILV
jgi:hypothetical protein